MAYDVLPAQKDGITNEQPATPGLDPYSDLVKVSSLISERFRTYTRLRYIFERDMYRNVLYYVGNQWILYDKGQRAWRRRNLPGWFPRPITNKFAEKANDIVAAIQKPTVSFVPTSADVASVALAEVGSQLERVCWKEGGLDAKEPLLKSWLVLTGNAFLLTAYDESESYGTTNLPGIQCSACGWKDVVDVSPERCPNPACPTNQPTLGPNPADPMGAPVMQPGVPPTFVDADFSVPKGKLTVEVLSPFEFFTDLTVQEDDKVQGFMRVRAIALDEAKELAKELWPGQLTDEEMMTADNAPHGTSALYMNSLSYVTSTFGSLGSGIPAPQIHGENKVTIYELWHLPSSAYPEGLYALRMGQSNKLLLAKPLPSKRRNGSYFLPYVRFGGDIVPGRYFRKTRLDDLVYKQNQRNLIEALIMLLVQRMGAPGWLIPRGSGIQTLTGEPGLKVTYNPISAGGTAPVKPERFSGEQIPQTLLLWLNKIDDDMERVAGTFFLAGGDTPPGVSAASALAYLGEKAQKAMSPWFQSYEAGFARWAEQALETLRTRAPEPRTLVSGGGSRWETERFVLTDLEGEVEAKVEAGSAFPQSQAALRSTIESLIGMRLLNPQDPLTAYNILQLTGLAHLSGPVNEDFKAAAREFDQFAKLGKPPQLDPVFDNHFAHFVQHQKDAKTDRYMHLAEQQKAMWVQHALGHMTALQQWQMSGFTPPQGGRAPQPATQGGGAETPPSTRQPGGQPGKAQGGSKGQTIPSIDSRAPGEGELEPSKGV